MSIHAPSADGLLTLMLMFGVFAVALVQVAVDEKRSESKHKLPHRRVGEEREEA